MIKVIVPYFLFVVIKLFRNQCSSLAALPYQQ